MQSNQIDEEIKEQYEDYPYPLRYPEDETKKFLSPLSDSLAHVNHYCYGGKQDFLSKKMRFLVAGGGTGDSTIYLAEQLRGTDSEIIYIDQSKASLKIAKERARVRKLDNITWIQDSLFNIPNLDLGKFDYISCIGVLHHLDDPNAGLQVLKNALSDDGMMLVLIYGLLGRRKTYKMQDLMRKINSNTTRAAAKLDNCRKVINSINQDWAEDTKKLISVYNIDNPELYDMFLHSRDKPYNFDELYKFIDSSKLEVCHFNFERHYLGNNFLDPTLYNKAKVIKNKKIQQSRKLAELFNYSIDKHIFYLSKDKKKKADPSDYKNIPFYNLITVTEPMENMRSTIVGLIKQQINQGIKRPYITALPSSNFTIYFDITPHLCEIMSLIDGKRTVKDIVREVSKQYDSSKNKPSDKSILEEFKNIYEQFNIYNWMLLRHKSTSELKDVYQIQEWFKDSLNSTRLPRRASHSSQ